MAGLIFAKYSVNSEYYRNLEYNRPDYKPFPAMVAQDQNDDTKESMMISNYASYKNKRDTEDRKRSGWYRYLFPQDADWTVRKNLHHANHKLDLYNPANGLYSTYTSDFLDHVQV